MSKLRVLLYYVHTNTYIQINYNCPSVLIMHLYIIVWFHIQKHFGASLSFMVSDSGHPVTYTREFFMNKPGHRIYCCVSARSTRHHTLLHNTTIIHTKTFLRQPVTRARKYCLRQNWHSLHWYNHSRLTHNRPFQNRIQTQIWFNTFPFFLL